jgi:anti-sigma B factor antagonist
MVRGEVPYNSPPNEETRELAMMTEALVVERADHFPVEVLELKGPLTAANAAVFQNAMRREEPAETVILDFSEVPYIDSSGLGTLLTAYVTRQKSGRRMVLSGINPRVKKLFDVTRTGGLFLIFSTPEEAVAALWGAARA